MANVVLVKNNVVISVLFQVNADSIFLSDTAKCGDIFNPVDRTFSTPQPPAPLPQPEENIPLDTDNP